MKTVYFIRHAKSSWDNASLRDIERPLSPRGLRDAVFMSKKLKSKNVHPDLIISSPANRALTTAKCFAKELNLDEDKIDVKNSIYEAYPDDVLQVIKKVNNSANTIMVFGHNPTFTSLVNRFTDDYIPNIPTCGIVKVEADIDSWNEFSDSTAVQTEFHFPKEYFT